MDTIAEGGQEIQEATWGGARQGAGRKNMRGGEEPTRFIRRQFTAYITEDEIKAIIASAVADALAGKADMQRYILDQVFGRAKQSVALSDPEGNALQFILAEVIANKNVIQINNANPERTDTDTETE
jgi:regulator of extracellular matrix RemA (YlzA/DUF370 family)